MKKRKVKWSRRQILTGMLIGLFCLLLCFVFCPWFLQVALKENVWYEGQSVQKENLQVETVSLFGLSRKCKDFTLVQTEDKWQISHGTLGTDIILDGIPIAYLDGVYDGKLYQYDDVRINAQDFTLNAVYENGMVKPLTQEQFEVSKLPDTLEQDFVVQLKAFGESVNVTIRPIKVINLQVSYQGGLHVGETFDKKKLKVTVQFADGTKRDVSDVSCDFEGIVTADTEVSVVSKMYGKAVLRVDKSNIDSFDMDYRHTIYEGDVVEPKDLKFVVKYTDGSGEEVKDLSFDAVQVFPSTKITFSSSLFGTMNGTLSPVVVKRVDAKSVLDTKGKLVVEKLVFVYADGHTKELNLDEITWMTDLLKPLSAGNHEIKFQWCGHSYSFMTIILS